MSKKKQAKNKAEAQVTEMMCSAAYHAGVEAQREGKPRESPLRGEYGKAWLAGWDEEQRREQQAERRRIAEGSFGGSWRCSGPMGGPGAGPRRSA